MNTLYNEIFDIFIGRITDHDFLRLPDEDIEDLCTRYLGRAIAKFSVCDKDLTDRDDEFGYFNFKLETLEKEILGTMMVTEWLTPQVYNIMNTKQFLGDKEYNHYSQANHLGKLIQLKDVSADETNQLLIDYTLHEIEGLK